MPVQDRELGEKLSPVRDAPCRAGLTGQAESRGWLPTCQAGATTAEVGQGVGVRAAAMVMVVAQGADGQWTGGLEEVSELSHGGTRASDQEDGRGTH